MNEPGTINQTCRNCPKCHGLWCDRHGKYVHPKDAWCKERQEDFDAWILG